MPKIFVLTISAFLGCASQLGYADQEVDEVEEAESKSTRGGIVTTKTRAEAPGPPKPVVDRDKPRSIAEIEYVIHENRFAIFRTYNRALRHDPTLQGDVMFKLEIMADGRIASCEIDKTEIDDKAFLEELCRRFLEFELEPIEVLESKTVTKVIRFYPR